MKHRLRECCHCVCGLCLLCLTALLTPPSLRPDDGTPQSPAWRFSGASLPEMGALVNLIISGGSESAVEDLVSSFLRQMNISRSELPQGFAVHDADSKAELSASFEDQRINVLRHMQRIGCSQSDLLRVTSQLLPTSSTSDESSGYQSEVSPSPSSSDSAMSSPAQLQVKDDPFLLDTQEESLLTNELNCCGSNNSQDSLFDGQYLHHMLTRHDSVEDALRSVLESQTMLQ